MEQDQTSGTAAAPPPPASTPATTSRGGSGMGIFPLEMLGYLGLALAVTGYSLVVGGTDLMQSSWGAILFMAVLTAALLVAGIMIRSDDDPPARRLCDVMWAISAFTMVVVIAGLIGQTMDSLSDIRTVILLVGLLSAVYAGALWAIRRRTLQLVVLWIMLIAFVGSIGSYIGIQDLLYPVVLVWLLGLLFIFLARSGTLEPKRPALVLGAILVGFAPALFGSPLFLGVGLGLLSVVFLFWLGAQERHTGVIGIAIFGTFTYIAQGTGEWATSSGVQIAMLVVGLVLLGYVLMTLRRGDVSKPV